MRISRRTAMAFAGGALLAGGAPMAARAYSSNNIGLPVLPLTLHNVAGLGRRLYVAIIGMTQSGNWYYVSDHLGNVTRCTPSSGYVTLAIPGPTGNTTQRLMFPQLSAVRVYLSLDRPLLVTVNASGSPSGPVGWVPDDINYTTRFDWLELTWDGPEGHTTLGGNATQVDMFGLPLTLQLSGVNGSGHSVTLAAGFDSASAFAAILTALRTAPAPWPTLVMTDGKGNAIRAISPYHAMERGTFPQTQLDGYITSVFDHYRTATLTTSAQGSTFIGQVTNGNLVFTATDGSAAPVVFAKPTSYEAYTTGPQQSSGGGAGGVIRAALQAGFMRTTLLSSSTLPDANPAQFYRSSPVNVYARIIHQYALNHHAYAFPFDDDAGQSSYIAVQQPTAMHVTVLPAKA